MVWRFSRGLLRSWLGGEVIGVGRARVRLVRSARMVVMADIV